MPGCCPLGPCCGGMDIGCDIDNLKQPVASPAFGGEATQAGAARAALSAPKPDSGMQQKAMPDEAQAEAGVFMEKPALEPPWVVEKRKTRSHGSAEELKLPASKRSRGKFKSPSSITRTSENQLATPQEIEQEIPPCSSNQVLLRHVFD